MDRTKRLTLLRIHAQDKILHAITKLFVPFYSVQDGDESAENELFSVLSTLLKWLNEQLCRNDNRKKEQGQDDYFNQQSIPLKSSDNQ